MIEIAPDGRALVGDPLVEHSAACLADALRDLLPSTRRALAAQYAEMAEHPELARTGRLREYFQALSRLCAEVDTEEIRRLNADLVA